MKPTPKKLTGKYRYIYEGQVEVFEATLKQHNMTIEDFNNAWTHIINPYPQNELSNEEKNPEYRQAIIDRIQRIINQATTKPEQQSWKPYSDAELLKIYPK